MIHKIISASLSPNTESDDVLCALRTLVRPWQWKRGGAIFEVISWFEKRFPNSKAFAYNSGRAAMTDILTAFGIGKGDDVLVQSYTCVAVPNSVLWATATPIYVDIDDTLNMDLDDAAKKITKKTKAIVVQHTLGLPANMSDIAAFVKKHNLIVIQDCAHSLGALSDGKDIGLFGDAAFFSFGRDKVLSSVFGGIAIVHTTHKTSIEIMNIRSKALPDAPIEWIFQQLVHPLIFSIVLPLYTLGIGKAILWLFQKLRLVASPVYAVEKEGKKPTVFPSRYPNALATLLCTQLPKLERYNAHRKDIAALYTAALKKFQRITFLSYPEGSIFLRFPILVVDPEKLIARAKKQGILLGNWYHNTIDPVGVNFSAIGYKKGSCPHAEHISHHIVNLPTNISEAEAWRIVELLKVA